MQSIGFMPEDSRIVVETFADDSSRMTGGQPAWANASSTLIGNPLYPQDPDTGQVQTRKHGILNGSQLHDVRSNNNTFYHIDSCGTLRHGFNGNNCLMPHKSGHIARGVCSLRGLAAYLSWTVIDIDRVHMIVLQ
jgi:hypothetical protein